MHRPLFSRFALTAGAVMLLTGIVAAPASAGSPPSKKTASAAVITSGSDDVFTLANTTNQPYSFGSANITLSSGFTWTQDSTLQSGFSLVNDGSNVIELRSTSGSGVAPKASISFSVQIYTHGNSCGSGWGVAIKQSNDFSSSLGNDFSVSPASLPPALPGNKLVFTTQPSSVQVGSPTQPVVTAEDGCGNPVQTTDTVKLVDSPTAVVTSSQEPPASGSWGASTTNGVADFSIVYTSYGFTDSFTATALTSDGSTDPSYGSVTSAVFDVDEVLLSCGSKCNTSSVTDSSGSTYSSAKAINTGGGKEPLALSVDGLVPPTAPACGNDQGEEPFGSYTVVSSGSDISKTVTEELTKAYVNQVSNNGTPFLDICVVSTTAFTDKFNDKDVTTGLLPDCGSSEDPTSAPPCVVSRNKNQANEYITFTLPPGDPTTYIR